MIYSKLKTRIKKNEGFSKHPYKDQLGKLTIGYGHLIIKKDKFFINKRPSTAELDIVFEEDFNRAAELYKRKFYKRSHSKKEKELLVEMIFQLGWRGVLKFKKMLFHINKKNKYLTCLEMIDSLWYKQTPKRVENLIKNYLI